MARERKPREPYVPPIRKIELSDRNFGLRAVATVLLLLIGVGALAYGIIALITPEGGWQEIKVGSSANLSCGDDFYLYYELGVSGESVTAENRAITSLYTDAAVHAYRVFDTLQSWDGVGNLWDVNHHPNEAVEVDPVLYEAFSLLEEHHSRLLYLGPLYGMYESLFFCQDDGEAANFDPLTDPGAAAFAAECAAFAQDPESIDLALLGDNRVQLHVSQEYLTWAAENEEERFLDFFWLKNAFIADDLADTLIDAGYTRGTLSSYDGYLRCLDSSGASYSLDFTARAGDNVRTAAMVAYAGPMAIVFLRDYPLNSMDAQRFYEYMDGRRCLPYVDPTDGLGRAALPELACFSREKGCAETLMEAAPLYVADQISQNALETLPAADIWPVWCDGTVIHASASELTFSSLYRDESVQYTLEQTSP